MTATPQTPQTPQAEPAREGWAHAHRWVIIAVIIGLVVVGLFTYGFNKHNEESAAKAQQLIARLQSAGVRAPSQESIESVLGTDGGPFCEDPGAALRKALVDQQLVNGAANVGMRPVIGETHLVEGTTIVLQVYCPDKVAAFREAVSGYQFDNVVNY